MEEYQSNNIGCIAMPLFLILAFVMFIIGYGIDNGLLNDATLSDVLSTAETTASELVADVVVSSDNAQSQVVVVPNGNLPQPVQSQPFIVKPPILQPAPQQQSIPVEPTATAYIPPAEPIIPVVITVTATAQPIITVTATIEPTPTPMPMVITATPGQLLINNGGQAPAPSQGCTSASLGIGCGEPAPPPSATPIPPTPLPLDNHGVGGPVPIGPTPEIIKVIPHEEVVAPEPTLYVIVGTEMFGDLSVRSTFNGQQSGWTCYSSKYNGENVNCPLLQIEEWKKTHEVIIKE